ncbi:MAG: hypothetical protein FWE21_04280 [Defluviitaleaceae bacterium]|nr:hypothetical protein [Defluviitaleaceae bacterium]
MSKLKLLNIGLIIYAIYYVIMVVEVGRRNIPFGMVSIITVVGLYLVALALLAVAIFQKRKWLAMPSGVLFIGWLAFAITQSTTSANEDAVLLAVIYAVAGLLALVLGWFRRKLQRK